jgi:nondiscriminating aspartyl-tRNA synthetase
MKALEHSGVREQAILEFTIPKVSNIPSLTFSEAKEILEQRGIKEATDDFSPNEEKELSRYVAQEGGGEFVFITHYPISARPFYTATEECPYSGELMTSSFDLLFRGVEITTGGQRIHDSKELEESMLKRGLDPVEFEFFAQAHRSGLPPHGGFGLGLERLTSQLIGVSSVKHCILYPRDTTRLSP